jgi:hypothetical protein
MSENDPDYEKNWEIEEQEEAKGEEGEDEDEDEDEDDEDDEDEDDEDEDEDEEGGEDQEGEYGTYEIDEDEDDIDPPPGDYDDPEYTGVDPRGQPAEYYQPEYNPEEGQTVEFKDEPEEREKDRWGNRGAMIFAILCGCCLILVAIALILVLLVFKEDGGDSPSSNNSGPNAAPVQPATFPTLPPVGAPVDPVPFSYPTPVPKTPPPTGAPTPAPTISVQPTKQPEEKPPTTSPTKYPTEQPTTSPQPTAGVSPSIVLIPIEDTYIVDGFEASEPHGDETTFLVQNALDHVNEVPDSFVLLKFDLSGIPFERIQNRDLSATLELTHEVSVLERGPATYTVERLPSTPLAVETLHLGLFPLPENGILSTTFDVAPDDEIVTIDVTNILFGGLYEPADDDQALLMLVNYGIEQDAGDRFRSRESVGSEPKLRLSLNRVPGVPDSTASPVVPPTLAPTVTAQVADTPGPTATPTATPTAEAGTTRLLR